MQAELSKDAVTEIVQSIFSTMIGVDVIAVDSPASHAGDRITSSVFLEGAWNGAVSLECSRQYACHVAGHFLAVEPPLIVDDDVRDVLGELANMIGGNIKSSISSEVRLSLPSVVDGSDYELRVCGSDALRKMAFETQDGVFWVTILSRDSCQHKKNARTGSTEVVM
jgi:Predicted inhibitor of MCP methylation, homolog of CheC